MGLSTLTSPLTSTSHSLLQHKHNPLSESIRSPSTLHFSSKRKTPGVVAKASLSSTKDSVLKEFHERRALKIIAGLQNFDRESVAAVVTAADKGGATHVDIACDPELVKLAASISSLKICVSAVDPQLFLAAVDAGAHMVEIGNYDSFYSKGIFFSPSEILEVTKLTRRLLPSIPLSVTVPHLLGLPDQVKLAEMLVQEGADIIQTEGGKCSNPSKAGVLGLIEKATPTLASSYSISRAVNVPVMGSSGLSAVTAPMAMAAGASGVGIGSAVNKLNDMVAMIAEVRSIADSMRIGRYATTEEVLLGSKRGDNSH